MELNSDPVEHILKVMDSRLLDIQDKLILLPNIDSNVKNITNRNPIRYHNKAHGKPFNLDYLRKKGTLHLGFFIRDFFVKYYAKNRDFPEKKILSVEKTG
jgi:hypothetical protein